MFKIFRIFALCAISIACASIASAQKYTTVDVPFAGAQFTALDAGPNPQGASAGFYEDAQGVLHGFLLQKGAFTSFDPLASTGTLPGWISPQGVIVGSYIDANGVSHGFILNNGKYTTVDFPGAAGTALSSLNPSGQMTGNTCSDPACGLFGAPSTNHSFVRSKEGVFTSFDPPGAVSSSASCVNPSGAIVGAYTDNAGVGHGYLQSQGKYTTIDYPGATFTFAAAINPEGEIVGQYTDAAGVDHGFLLSKDVFTSLDAPGSIFTAATGINPSGVIVGAFVDAGGVEHGFILTPSPETSWIDSSGVELGDVQSLEKITARMFG